MAYGYLNDLHITTVSDIVLNDKAFNIAKNPKYDAYERGLASIVYPILDKISASLRDKSASSSNAKSNIISNQELAEELQKPIIGKFEK